MCSWQRKADGIAMAVHPKGGVEAFVPVFKEEPSVTVGSSRLKFERRVSFLPLLRCKETCAIILPCCLVHQVLLGTGAGAFVGQDTSCSRRCSAPLQASLASGRPASKNHTQGRGQPDGFGTAGRLCKQSCIFRAMCGPHPAFEMLSVTGMFRIKPKSYFMHPLRVIFISTRCICPCTWSFLCPQTCPVIYQATETSIISTAAHSGSQLTVHVSSFVFCFALNFRFF